MFRFEVMTTGKWKEPGVPHKGWRNVDIEDVGSNYESCEMCEVREIRYVHVMQHQEYPSRLRVGCICAGHMEQDIERAKEREKTKANIARRRSNWLKRKWHTDFKNGEYVETDGFRIEIWPQNDVLLRAKLYHHRTGIKKYSTEYYPDIDSIKLAAFDKMIEIKNIIKKKGW